MRAEETAAGPTAEHRINTAALIAGGALVGFGVILWIAANWVALDKFAKFGLVGGAALAGALAAVVWPALRTPGALVAFAGIGGLFALFGQVYQSGADPWQLFALWAALGLPLALAARHDALFVPWTAVSFTGIGLWLATETNRFDTQSVSLTLMSWGFALGIIALLIGLALLFRPARPTVWATRLAVIMATMMVVGAGIADLFIRNGSYTLFWLALALLALGAFVAAVSTPFELSLLAALALGLDVLLIAGIVRIVSSASMDFTLAGLVVFAVSAAVLGTSASLLLKWNARRNTTGTGSTLVTALDWIRRRNSLRQDQTPSADAASGTTWPITVLSGIGALIATVPLLVFFFALFQDALKNGPTVYILSVLLLIAAVYLLRRAKNLSFMQQFGFILLVSAMSLTTFGLLRDFNRTPTMATATLLALTIGLAIILPIGWIRNLLGAAGGFAALFLISEIIGHGNAMLIMFEQQFFGAVVVSLIAAFMIWQSRHDALGEPNGALLQSYAAGFAPAALGTLILAAGPTFLLRGGFGTLESTRAFGITVPAAVAPALSVIATLAGAGLLWRAKSMASALLPAVVTAVLAALSVFVTTLGFAVLILCVALIARRRILAVYAAMAGLWIIGSIYYSLAWPLDTKGFFLIGLGLVLGLAALVSRRHSTAAEPKAATGLRSALAGGLIGLSTLGTAGVFASALVEKEAILKQGETIYIALVPVDPRAIMQGDYMALRFALPDANAVFRRASEAKQTPVAIASVDARRVATITRIALPPPQIVAGERVMKMRREQGTWRIGTNAWFFREGEGKKFESAAFGEFRLGPAGDLILVGMADKDLNPIR